MFAGILGVALWPLYFTGVTSFYPGQAHARIMADGLFGGCIFGFLGTAMPRMLAAPPFETRNVLVLFCLHLATVLAFAAEKIFWGDNLFLVLLCVFAALMLRRARHRKDIPPPGFVLVGLSFLSVFAGTVLAVIQPWSDELDYRWVTLQKLFFGHSGNLERLKARNWGLLIAVALMLFGMATRISGDFWPRIMASHYIYGAVLWTAGVLLWSSYVLPKIVQVEIE